MHHVRAPLPVAMVEGNSEDFGTACHLGKDLHSHIVENNVRENSQQYLSGCHSTPCIFSVHPHPPFDDGDALSGFISSQGWEPEDLNGKYGLVSQSSGAALVLNVGAVAKSLTVSFTRGPDDYFGDAILSCEAGCACDPERISSRFPANNVRTMRQFFLKLAEPAAQCHLRFVAQEARSLCRPTTKHRCASH